MKMSSMDHTIRHAEVLFEVRFVSRVGDDFAVLPAFPPKVFGLDGFGFDRVFKAPFVHYAKGIGGNLDASAELCDCL